jgi:hypothetical protein
MDVYATKKMKKKCRYLACKTRAMWADTSATAAETPLNDPTHALLYDDVILKRKQQYN